MAAAQTYKRSFLIRMRWDDEWWTKHIVIPALKKQFEKINAKAKAKETRELKVAKAKATCELKSANAQVKAIRELEAAKAKATSRLVIKLKSANAQVKAIRELEAGKATRCLEAKQRYFKRE
jgi:hypothetical protein